MSVPVGSVSGVGIGWRPEIDGAVRALPGLRWCEVVAESVDPRRPPDAIAALVDAGVAVVPHGTRLSLGGAEPVDPRRVAAFAAVVDAVRAPLASEHIAYVRAGGVEAGHLLPLPRTRAAVDAVVRNVRTLTAELDVPFALEPIASVFDWPDDEMTEGQFVTEICERTDARLLLDVANVYANARNRGADPHALFAEIPLERIAYVHMAGSDESTDGLYHDTHTAATPPEVLALLADLVAMAPVPAVMLERDGRYPPTRELHAELDAIADAARHPRVTPT